MDNAVSLVQAYLRINGYFTVAEYPVVEALPDGGHRVATDLDILAFRFPRSGRLVPGAAGTDDYVIADPDPALNIGADDADMIIGEVKMGEASINRALTHRPVLRAALARFGGLSDEAPRLAGELMSRGKATTDDGVPIRVVAFGSTQPYHPAERYEVILLPRILAFLEAYVSDHWEVLRHAEFSDPALGFLMTLEKARRG